MSIAAQATGHIGRSPSPAACAAALIPSIREVTVGLAARATHNSSVVAIAKPTSGRPAIIAFAGEARNERITCPAFARTGADIIGRAAPVAIIFASGALSVGNHPRPSLRATVAAVQWRARNICPRCIMAATETREKPRLRTEDPEKLREALLRVAARAIRRDERANGGRQ